MGGTGRDHHDEHNGFKAAFSRVTSPHLLVCLIKPVIHIFKIHLRFFSSYQSFQHSAWTAGGPESILSIGVSPQPSLLPPAEHHLLSGETSGDQNGLRSSNVMKHFLFLSYYTAVTSSFEVT